MQRTENDPAMKMIQMFITDYFPVIRRRGNVHCHRCKKKFISIYHRSLHTRGDRNCPWRPLDKPKYKLEYLNEEILLHIASYLSFDFDNSLTNFIHALPRVLFLHGIKSLWNRRLQDCDYAYRVRWRLFTTPMNSERATLYNENWLTNSYIMNILSQNKDKKVARTRKFYKNDAGLWMVDGGGSLSWV